MHRSIEMVRLSVQKQTDFFAWSHMRSWGRLAATAGLLFILFTAGLFIVQNGTAGLAGNDGYYHIKMGYLIRTEGLKPLFDYLPFTILNEQAYYDHHLLYHVWLALFAAVDPLQDGGVALTQGAKWASILMPSFAFVVLWWLLEQQQIRFPAVWSLALLGISEAFLYRMSMPRAQSLSLLLLVLGVHWLLQEKRWHLLGLGFVYVWAYNAFPLLLVVAAVYIIATMLIERRLAWQMMAFPAVGIGLGLVINPYFPQNIDFIMGHLAPKLGESATAVGNEWNPYQTWTLVRNSWGTLLLFVLGIGALGWQDQRIDKRTLFAFGLTLIFGYLLFESRRFIEYFPPFVLIFFVFSLHPILEKWLELWSQRGLTRWLTEWLPLLLVLVMIVPIFQTLTAGKGLMKRSKPADQYAAASLWLHGYAGEDINIFQTDWDDFTRLFFYNSHARYTAGLDPTFMELHDPEKFTLWVDITNGRVDNPAGLIREQFGSQYIFSDLKHQRFLEQIEPDPDLIELYRDEYAVIYEIRPEKQGVRGIQDFAEAAGD